MKFCDIGEGPLDYKGSFVWCEDHGKPANHCGTDGDSPVCEDFVKIEGCNCCKENFNRGVERMEVYQQMSQVQHADALKTTKKALKGIGLKDERIEEIVNELHASGIIFLSLKLPEDK